jgi:hypothetical protein
MIASLGWNVVRIIQTLGRFGESNRTDGPSLRHRPLLETNREIRGDQSIDCQTDNARHRHMPAQLVPFNRNHCRPTGLVGLGLSAVALLRLPEPVEPQLYPAVHAAARGVVATTGFAQPARPLWDSRQRRALLGHARTSLFARSDVKLWDSRSSSHGENGQIFKLVLLSGRQFLRKHHPFTQIPRPCGSPVYLFEASKRSRHQEQPTAAKSRGDIDLRPDSIGLNGFFLGNKSGGPGRIRTYDQRIMSPPL